MKKWTFFVLSALLMAGCSTDSDENPIQGMDDKKFEYQDSSKAFDVRLKDYLKNAIGVEEGENYSINTYKEHINNDNELDIILTVNRKEFAFKNAQRLNSVAKHSSVDYFGNYNYIVMYSSKTNQFSSPIIIASSAYKPLELYFENIGPYKHKDMIIDYTIGDAKFRKYFLFSNDNDKINYAFRWTVFEDWNKGNPDGACFEYVKGSRSEFKDILVKRAVLTPLKKDEDYNKVDAQLNCTDSIIKRFFFNPQDGKYYTADI